MIRLCNKIILVLVLLLIPDIVLSASLLDSYSESNYSAAADVSGNTFMYQAVGQVFNVPYDCRITSVKFYILSNPDVFSGNSYAKLYATTGTYGVNATGGGTPLATSDPIAVETMGYDFALQEFTFSTPYSATTGEILAVVFEYLVDYGQSLYMLVGMDDSSPSHGGNFTRYQNEVWLGLSDYDICFYIYGNPITSSRGFSLTGGIIK